MFITSISLSYIFLGIAIVSLIFFIYFKVLYVKTAPDKKSRQDIIGKMKDPLSWRNKNNKMSYLSFFWFIISIALYVYLKFFFKPNLVSIAYIFIYIALIAISNIILIKKQKPTV